MEEMEARVWQRVSGSEPMELTQLVRLCRTAAADYRNLAAGCTGETRQTLLALHQEAAFAAQAITGMIVLRGLEPPTSPVCFTEKQRRRSLSLAYRRSRTIWEAFQVWSSSAEFGLTFRTLAHREESISARLLALIAACPVHKGL